jgi:hypothetical protein
MLLAALPLVAGDGIPFWLPCGWRSASLSTLLVVLPVDVGGDGIPFNCPVVGGLPPKIFCWSRFRGGLLSLVVCPVVGILLP